MRARKLERDILCKVPTSCGVLDWYSLHVLPSPSEVRNIYASRPGVQRKAGPTINRGDRMRRLHRFLPIALAIAALSIPIMALAQDMTMGPLATRENPTLGTIVTDLNGRTIYSWAGDTAGAG